MAISACRVAGGPCEGTPRVRLSDPARLSRACPRSGVVPWGLLGSVCPSPGRERSWGQGGLRVPQGRAPHHVVAGQQLLQELGLLVHHRLDDELIVAGDVEQRAAGAGVGQLDQRLVAQGVLGGQ